ncbi:MAG: hypothetical protein FD145_209 [Candidatus Saganbacteria bacterium]|uniref:GatB/YqeY domain-containing protein n=1 Tax=Candidatus Saganbacteria bacterium TaxID=2575572 RepID=A0A833L265_UNCSA|nr:MAG: hypothetical protein FD145_209 [Candidatus Saganbacteria bacterium]
MLAILKATIYNQFTMNTENNKTILPGISNDIAKAMKEKEELRLSVLRMMKSKILYVNARGDLPDPEIIKIIAKYAKELKESIEEAKKVDRPEAAKKTEAELKIVEEYLK